jgi:hypothetical protein
LAIAFSPTAFAADDMKKDTMTKDNISKDKIDLFFSLKSRIGARPATVQII